MGDVFKKIDWRGHAIGLTAFAVSCVVLIYAYYVYNNKTQAYIKTQSQLQQQKNKNRNALEQMEIYSQYHPQYERLQHGGIIGNKSRLQWLETLKKISELYRIPGIDFTLHQAQIADSTNEQYFNDQLPLKTTKMELSLDMLHEGDWYNVLNYLHHHGLGLFSVEECDLNRVNQGKNQFSGLKGQCILKWYTMEDITQEEVMEE